MGNATAVAAAVEFHALGPIEVVIDGVAVDVGGSRQRRLLALLLSRSGELVESDTLAECVWDDRDRPDNATDSIRTYISRLRRSMATAGLDASALLVTQHGGYRLDVGAATIDGERFEAEVLAARALLDGGDAPAALRAL